eukprot:1179724-Prorocentrum_minimum.AAC.1
MESSYAYIKGIVTCAQLCYVLVSAQWQRPRCPAWRGSTVVRTHKGIRDAETQLLQRTEGHAPLLREGCGPGLCCCSLSLALGDGTRRIRMLLLVDPADHRRLELPAPFHLTLQEAQSSSEMTALSPVSFLP